MATHKGKSESSGGGGWSSKLDQSQRDEADLYTTPEAGTEALLKHVSFRGSVWECASGLGDITRVFERRKTKVISTDLFAERNGFGSTLDFLSQTSTLGDNIVTNPPYKLLVPFIRHALTLDRVRKVAMHCPLPAVPAMKLWGVMMEFGHPHMVIAIVPALKVSCGLPPNQRVITSFFRHCWLIWDKTAARTEESRFVLHNWKQHVIGGEG